jgi:hypothetical protein
MGDKLDKEKGWYTLLFNSSSPLTLISSPSTIESLEAPDFERNASTDLIRQRAEDFNLPARDSNPTARGFYPPSQASHPPSPCSLHLHKSPIHTPELLIHSHVPPSIQAFNII